MPSRHQGWWHAYEQILQYRPFSPIRDTELHLSIKNSLSEYQNKIFIIQYWQENIWEIVTGFVMGLCWFWKLQSEKQNTKLEIVKELKK